MMQLIYLQGVQKGQGPPLPSVCWTTAGCPREKYSCLVLFWVFRNDVYWWLFIEAVWNKDEHQHWWWFWADAGLWRVKSPGLVSSVGRLVNCVFYAAEASLELALLLSVIACNVLMLFIISCGQIVWLFITWLPWLFGMCLFFSALAPNMLPAEHVIIVVPKEACGSHYLHVHPVWLLLHIPVISHLVLSPNFSSSPALPVQEMMISARARFFKWVSLPAVTSPKPSGEASTSSFHISVDMGHILCSHHCCCCTSVDWRAWGRRDSLLMLLPKGWLGRCIALKAGVCMLVYKIIFAYEWSGGPLGRGKRRVGPSGHSG